VQNALQHIDVSHCLDHEDQTRQHTDDIESIAQQHTIATQSKKHTTGSMTGDISSSDSSLSRSSPSSPHLIYLSLFHALEERGFRGNLVWQHAPTRQELIGKPVIVEVTLNNPSQQQQRQMSSTHPTQPVPALRRFELRSAFLDHYQRNPSRLIDLALRDITDSALTPIPWEWIRQQDAMRRARLARHRVQLGEQPYIHDNTTNNMPMTNGYGMTSTSSTGSFVRRMESEVEAAERARLMAAGSTHFPPSYRFPTPRFYALDLTGALVTDRLLFYILANWGRFLYSLTLDSLFITSKGLR